MKEIILETFCEVFETDRAALPSCPAISNMEQWDSIHHLRLIEALERKTGKTIDPLQYGNLIDVPSIEKILAS